MSSYWHGGVPDLKPGDLIEPRPLDDPSHLRDGCPTCEARRNGTPLADDDNDPSRIYVTSDKHYARIFAAGYGNGALYRVEPIGDLTPCENDGAPSWACDAARVISVYDPLVRMSPAEIRRAVRRYAA